MKGEFSKLKKVINFTFYQQLKTKGFLATLIIVSLIAFALPAGIMIGSELSKDDGGETYPTTDVSQEQPIDQGEEIGGDAEALIPGESTTINVKNIYYTDSSQKPVFEISKIKKTIEKNFNQEVTIKDYGDDTEGAFKDGEGSSDTVIMIASDKDGYTLDIVIPKDSTLPAEEPYILSGALDEYIAFVQSKLSLSDAGEGGSGGSNQNPGEGTTTISPEEEAQAQLMETKKMLTWIASYLNILLIYFFGLIYGQGVANSIVLEKNSKLMEAVLVSLKPVTIISGKVIAVAFSGMLQLGSWIVSLVLGFSVGTFVVEKINPQTDMAVIAIIRGLQQLVAGMFSPGNIALAIIFALLGIILYCTLAAVGGSLASKTEDLSATNILFTMIILISFMWNFYGGTMSSVDGGIGFEKWLPFTSVMIMPARILVGSCSMGEALGSMAVTITFIALLALLSGKIYKAMVFYRGEAMNPIKFLMLNTKKR